MFRPFQPVLPLLQHHLYHQKFPISDVVVSLNGVETMAQEGTGIPLGQDAPHSNVRNVYLNHKLMGPDG
jgi:hypothetical protein